MSLLIVLLVLGLVAVFFVLVATIRGDGLGHRPAPASTPSDPPRWRQLGL